jgi:hypothetical protein
MLMVAMVAPAARAQEQVGPESGEGDVATVDAAPAVDESVYPLVFPVGGPHSFTDTFGAPRDGGRSHEGTDIFAAKLTPVVAVANGVITTMRTDGLRAGVFIGLTHNDGWSSWYMHLNNDTPDTDDGLGVGFVDGLTVGASVVAGEVIGFVGDSGNAEDSSPHLHFELHDPGNAVINPYPHLAIATGVSPGPLAAQVTPTAAPAPAPLTENTSLVGHFDPGGGFNADVWVANDTAYLSSWGRPTACPEFGVRIIDVSDPAQPSQIGVFANGTEFPQTSAEDLWVGPVESPTFQGELAVAAIRLCDTSEPGRIGDTFRGIALYDVTDPALPVLLSTLDTGERTQGVHQIQVVVRPDGRIVAVASVPQSFLHHPEAKGDIRILDLTDPTAPRELADWDFRRDAPAELVEPLLAARGDEELRGHGVSMSPDGMGLYVGHWDAGMVRLDITEPEAPIFVSATSYGEEEEGNAHSGWYDPDGHFLISNDEDLSPEEDEEGHVAGWGYQHIYDLSDPTQPVEISTFATENAVPGTDGEIGLDGFYTSHDVAVAGDLAVSSWYSDGVRVLDLTDLANPVEVGYFVPPPAPDPQGYWIAPDGTLAFAAVWGVQLEGDLVYVSDINSGLWIFRIGEEDPEAVPAETGIPEPNEADSVESDTDPAAPGSDGYPGSIEGGTDPGSTGSDVDADSVESVTDPGSAGSDVGTDSGNSSSEPDPPATDMETDSIEIGTDTGPTGSDVDMESGDSSSEPGSAAGATW